MKFQVVAYKHDVRLEIEKQGETFKPGLSYNVIVVLKQMDDQPVKATMPRRVQITTYYNYPFVEGNQQQHEDKEVKIVDLDAHGTAPVELRVIRIKVFLMKHLFNWPDLICFKITVFFCKITIAF